MYPKLESIPVWRGADGKFRTPPTLWELVLRQALMRKCVDPERTKPRSRPSTAAILGI